MRKSVWVVEVLGDAASGEYEISVVRANNPMRGRSWGWFGEDKILVTHNGITPVPTTDKVWQGLIALAETVAREMNEEEYGGGRKIVGPDPRD